MTLLGLLSPLLLLPLLSPVSLLALPRIAPDAQVHLGYSVKDMPQR